MSAQTKSHPGKESGCPIDWHEIARLTVLSRQMDCLEVEELAPQDIVKYQFSASGHELAQILLARALTHPHDAAAVYYRSRPFLLACGLTPVEALAAGMAKINSPSEGRDVGVEFNLPRRSGPTVLPSSGGVGTQYTPAAGWAQAICYRQNVLMEDEWRGAIAVAEGGEGSTASNGFWSALNMATTLKLPLLFFIENNQFGISVPVSMQTPGGDLSKNLSAFEGLYVIDGDGTAPQLAWKMICHAVDWVRNGSGPALLQMNVPRLQGHTYIDDQSYKSAELRAEEAARDPLDALHKYLLSQGENPDVWAELEQKTKEELLEATKRAEAYPNPASTQTTKYLFFEGTSPQQGGLRPENAQLAFGTEIPQSDGPRINLVEAVRRALEYEMARNPRILVFGEDVGAKGGVHGATLDMQTHFGVDRVFDTSLSEEGIIGRAVGMALAGLMPVPEIQFRKYADPAHEQLSDLGTIRWRTANHFAAPVVVRIPVGFGKKTGDPWHSLSGEAIYAHLPGWRIAYPSNASDAVGLLRTALRSDDPTFFLEHRALLDTVEGRRPYPGDDFCLPFGKAATLIEGTDLTVITWGAMVPRCLIAAQSFAGRILLLDLRTICPWDWEAVLESVRRTGKVLVVHEDTLTGGFAAEILATIASQAFESLDAPPARLTTPDVPIPYNIQMMEAVLPSVQTIHAELERLLNY